MFIGTLSFAQKAKKVVKEKVGLIFISSFTPFDSTGFGSSDTIYMKATEDIFIPIRKYWKADSVFELFKTDNLIKGFWLGNYKERKQVLSYAQYEYISNVDSSSCYYSSSFRLMPVKLRYRVLWYGQANNCNQNKIEILSSDRVIKFSYNTWTIEIISITPLIDTKAAH